MRLLLPLALAALLAAPAALASPDDPAHRALDFLRSLEQPDGHIGAPSDTAWSAVAFARGGVDPATVRAGGASACDAVVHDTTPGLSVLSLERQVLALDACHLDPRSAAGFDAIMAVAAASDGQQVGDPCLLNDDIFALQALVASGVPASDALVQQERAFVLDNQQPLGGWSFATLDAVNCPDDSAFGLVFTDADDTAAAMVALLHSGSAPGDAPIVRAEGFLKLDQTLDGGCAGSLPAVNALFAATSADPAQVQAALGGNADSTSWGIMGLRAAGQDPTGLVWTVPVDHTLVSFLLGLQQADGHFDWRPGDGGFAVVSTTAWAAVALLGHDFVE